jgi:hypothetical protein
MNVWLAGCGLGAFAAIGAGRIVRKSIHLSVSRLLVSGELLHAAAKAP